jgi:MFS family permease
MDSSTIKQYLLGGGDRAVHGAARRDDPQYRHPQHCSEPAGHAAQPEVGRHQLHLSLAVGIPISGWMADRYGTRRVFGTAIAIFTLASVLCGLSLNVPMLTAARFLQGLGGAMMMPVGRLAIIRTFPKSELLGAMNFVIIPALLGTLLGPTVGGLIVHWTSWRAIFFVNVPVGLVALYLVYRYMPDYQGSERRPLDVIGMILFSCGTALLSWLLEVFGEHTLDPTTAVVILAVAITLLAAYAWHASGIEFPLLRLALFRIRPSGWRCWRFVTAWASAACRSCCRCCIRSDWACRHGSRASMMPTRWPRWA